MSSVWNIVDIALFHKEVVGSEWRYLVKIVFSEFWNKLVCC
jgi:hypothetical protein